MGKTGRPAKVIACRLPSSPAASTPLDRANAASRESWPQQPPFRGRSTAVALLENEGRSLELFTQGGSQTGSKNPREDATRRRGPGSPPRGERAWDLAAFLGVSGRQQAQQTKKNPRSEPELLDS